MRTPKLPISVNGAGDAIAALFFAHLSAQRLGRRGVVARRVVGLRRAQAHRGSGSREILLVEAQDEFVNPSRVFEPEKI